jgi:hypothetical protein
MTTAAARQTALVTGASAGLGVDYARLLAADGHDVILVARRRDRLEELAAALTAEHGIAAHVMPCDLAAPGAAAALFDHITAAGLSVDILINNAGFGSNGPFSDSDPQWEVDMVAVNITALVHLTRLCLPPMLTRGYGRILNVGSTAGFQAGPFMATYYASKAFVNHFSEALSHELAGTGVTVTVSCPGPVATEFSGIAGNDTSKLFKGKPAASADIAREAYAAMTRGTRMIVHGVRNRIAVQALRISPRSAIHKIALRLNRP